MKMEGKLTTSQTSFRGAWPKHLLAALVLVVMGLVVWPQRIDRAGGFLLDDAFLLNDTYTNRYGSSPARYLPWVTTHRPGGRDAFTLLVTLFGEREAPMIWACLAIHLASAVLVWQALYRFTDAWWAALAGATAFLLNVSAYLPIYWPVDVFDTLATFLTACLLLAAALITRPRGEYRPWLLLLTLPLLLAAVKTKESTIVVIVPLLLLVFFHGRGGGRDDSPRPPVVGALVARLREVRFWEAAWVVLSAALLGTLVLNLATTLGPKDPTHPYYPEYTPYVIGRSFVFYLALLVFQYREVYPVHPYAGLALALAPFAVALLLKNRLMLYGWLWYVVFLLPLAALKNHYNYIYYPYSATVGLALAVAAFMAQVGGRDFWSGRAGLPRRALPAAFVLATFAVSYAWVRGGAAPEWIDNYHARSAVFIRSLKEALPAPAPGSEVVLVIPEFTQFNQDPGVVLKVVYHDPTLTGALFKEPREAEAYVAGRGGAPAYLATWNGSGFDVKGRPRP